MLPSSLVPTASRGTVKTLSLVLMTISTLAGMPTSRPLSCPLTVTVAPKLPLSLATGSIRVRVPVTVSSVASLVMLHCRPVLSLPTELAGIVTSTVRLSTS